MTTRETESSSSENEITRLRQEVETLQQELAQIKKLAKVLRLNDVMRHAGESSEMIEKLRKFELLAASQIALQKAEAQVETLTRQTRWRDIETAPKDGTCVLLWCADIDGRRARVEVGTWHKTYRGSWWNTGMEYTHDYPTKWMPLPPSPEAREGE